MQREDAATINLAKRLRELYSEEKQKRTGKKYTPCKRYDYMDAWIRTAKVVQKLNAKPEDYIEAQFRFSRSAVFANTLHGPTAVKRYEKLKAITQSDQSELVGVSPGHMEIINRIADLVSALVYAVESTNIKNPDVKKFVLDPMSDVDPVAAYLLFSTEDEDVKNSFRDKVKSKLKESPYLHRAIEELGYNIDIAYDELE